MASIFDWSVTAGDNDDIDTDINWLEGQFGQTVNNSARAMMAKVAGMVKLLRGAYTTTNVGNDYSIAMDFTPSALSKGFFAVVRFNAANTGAVTLTNGLLAAAAVKSAAGLALTGGEIAANGLYLVIYDTTANEYRIVSSLGVGGVQSFTVDDAVNNAVTTLLTLTHTTSGGPANGIGAGINFVVETSNGNNETGMQLQTVVDDVTAGSEDFAFVVNLMQAGAAASQVYKLTSTGAQTLLNTVVGATGASLTVQKSRNGAIIADDDVLYSITAQGHDGTTFRSAAAITMAIDGTPASNDMPGRISFWVSDNGSVTPTERWRIDHNGDLISNDGNDAITMFGVGSHFQINGLSSGYSGAQFGRWANNANGVNMHFSKSRGATVGSYTVINDGDRICSFVFGGSDGTDMEEMAYIYVEADGTPGNNDVPGRMIFGVTEDGSTTAEEVLRLKSTGYITTDTNLQLIPGVTFKVLSANDTGGQNVNTAQPWFPTAGAVAVNGDTTYLMEGLLWLSRSAGANSHTTSLLFGGTATLTSIMYRAMCNTGDVATNIAMNSTSINVATATVVKAASTSTTEQIIIHIIGTIRINAAGTLIPQFQYSAAPGGAPTVLANSFFKLTDIGAGAVTTQGTWS